MSDFADDEKKMLSAFRKARVMGHADISMSIKDGKLVKLHITEKLDIGSSLKEPSK